MANGFIPGVLMMALAQQQVQEAIRTGTPLSSGTVAALMATPTSTPAGCEKTQPLHKDSQKDSKEPEDLEVVAIVEGTVPAHPEAQKQMGFTYFPYAFNPYFAQNVVRSELTPLVTKQSGGAWPLDEIRKHSAEVIPKYFEVEQTTPEGNVFKAVLPPELQAGIRRSYWVESILQLASQEASLRPNLSDSELAQKMANAFEVASQGNSREKAALFATWVSRMYENYNDEMNPGRNQHPIEDSKQIPLSKAVQSAVGWDLTYGGVCTNIAKAAAVLGEKVFQGSDALVINSGTHFYNAFIDRDQNVQVFNWSSVQAGQRLMLSMDPALPTTNLRISKINQGGKLAEVAVPLNQRGLILQKMHGALSPSFSLEQDPSLARIKTTKGTLSTQVAAALTQQSRLWVVMASRDLKDARLSISGAYEQMNTAHQSDPARQNVIVGLHYSWLKPIVHYQSPRVRLDWHVGGDLQGTFGAAVESKAKLPERVSSIVPGFSVNGELMTRVRAQNGTATLDPKKAKWMAEAGVVGFVGVKDWEHVQYWSSLPKSQGIRQSLEKIRLPLQQVFVNAEARTPAQQIKQNSVQGAGRVQYQGTAVGQQVRGELGVEIQSAAGIQVYAYAGYLKNDLKGFKTQYSAFQAPMGATTRAGVRTPNGASFELGTQGKSGNAKAILPIRGRKK